LLINPYTGNWGGIAGVKDTPAGFLLKHGYTIFTLRFLWHCCTPPEKEQCNT